MKLSCQNNLHNRDLNRGAALASAVILLVSLTLVAVTVAYRATLDEQMAANQRDAVNAMSLADSGIETGFAEVKANYSELPQALCDIATAGTNLVEDPSISGGSYAVTVNSCVVSDSAVLRSVGLVNGAERVVELLVEMAPGGGGSDHTILTNDYITMSNSQKFVGPIISVHSNSYINNSGDPITCTTSASCGTETTPPPGFMSAVGAINADLFPQWTKTEFTAAEIIPHVYPPDWLPFATVEMTHDCQVKAGQSHPTLAAGTVIHDVATSGKWSGWACNADRWELNDGNATLYDGFYYFHGNAKITSTPAVTWKASFVAAGYIEITGSPIMQPWGQTGDDIADDIFLLAGNDIMVSGSPGQVYTGIIAAHMEVKVTGAAHFKGSILAENGLYQLGQEVLSNVQRVANRVNRNEFTNQMTLEGTGVGLGGAGEELAVAGWRELVH